MSYEPFPQGIYLFVKYHGSKAAQYFTNEFTNNSDFVFRQDLTRMKFPYSQPVNTRLAPGALVVIWWPDVSHTTHDELYNKLEKCTNAASLGVLSQLSISLLALREIEATGKAPKLLAYAKEDNIVLPTLRGLPPPAKRQKLDTDSSFRELTLAQRLCVPPSTTGTTSTAQKRTWDGQWIPFKPSTLVPQRTEVLSSTQPSRRTAHVLPPKPPTAHPPPTRNTTPPVTRGLPIAPPASYLPGIQIRGASGLNSALGPPEPPANPSYRTEYTELETLRKPARSMEETLRMKLNMAQVCHDETTNKLEAEQEARKRLEETSATARKGEADARRRLEETQKLLAEEGRRSHEANEHAASLWRELIAYQDTARRERDDFEREYARMRGALSLMEDDLDVARRELKRTDRDLEEEKARRRRYQDRLASAERREEALKQRCDEVMQETASLTCARQKDELEAVRLRDDKTRAQYTMVREAEVAMHAAQDSETALKRRFDEVETQLSRAESQLKTEMRLRREAEDAIADIRRECREPFVVPSLLDAFVELAKLTTAATTSGGLDTGIDGRVEKDMLGHTRSTTDVATDAAGDTGATATGTITNESPLITVQRALLTFTLNRAAYPSVESL